MRIIAAVCLHVGADYNDSDVSALFVKGLQYKGKDDVAVSCLSIDFFNGVVTKDAKPRVFPLLFKDDFTNVMAVIEGCCFKELVAVMYNKGVWCHPRFEDGSLEGF